ncbi:hypothetical protein KKD52_07370 [Myxococcota bacterium]|nr:hypothetical protein [Myxococcota bacterium]MBU1413372.1 hypothetical protein [Myxococcota bacterium]MBU1510166.1 hypothetical protein [Myxococcota bacterium]PKN26907.1 MAG: hypothetical protein CVU65_04245 [Deltaproteobacteria bacterium HGW-Deltaproteobacteria-22]
MTRKTLFTGIAVLLFASLFSWGCASSSGKKNNNSNTNNVNNDQDCPASVESGYWLVPVGQISQEVLVGGTARLKAMVVRRQESENLQDALVPFYALHYEITTGPAGSLDETDPTTDENGISTVNFTATEAGTYRIMLTGDGVCSVQYTVVVQAQLVSIEALPANPSVTYINRKISLGVRAFSRVGGVGEMPLGNAAVQFEFLGGGTGAIMEDRSGSQGATLTVNTDASGNASLFLLSGSSAFTAQIRATLTGMSVEPLTMSVTINATSTGPCETSIDCGPDAPICDGGVCVEGNTSGTCETNEDCISPYICNTEINQCAPPVGERCNMLSSANQCPSPKVCIGGYCVEQPGDCLTHDDCPFGFDCINGTCVPTGDPECTPVVDCPDPNDVCVNGNCINPDTECQPLGPPTRLGGTWNFDSMLHLREAVGPFLGGILTGCEFLRDVILGTWSIGGIPSWLMSIIADLVDDLIDEYIPPWAQQMIIVLGDVSDIVDDMRVYHTVFLIPMGNNEYYGTQVWDIVEFDYRGNIVSDSPQNILGFSVHPEDFTSREICGTFYIDRHRIENVVGGLVRWAIEAMVTIVSCSSSDMPCYYSLEEALEDIIDCDSIAVAIEDLVWSIWEDAPSVYSPVYSACDSQKQNAINAILNALDNITVQLNLLSLRGMSPIVTDRDMHPGRWFGSLAGGNFTGDFTAIRP